MSKYVVYKVSIVIGMIIIVVILANYLMRDKVNEYISYGKHDPITHLMKASIDGDEDQVIRLLNRHADLELTGGGGYTALNFAINKGHYQIARILLKAGANPNHLPPNHNCSLTAIMKNGRTAKEGNFEFFVYYLACGADPLIAAEDPLFYAIEHDHPKYLQALMDSVDSQRSSSLVKHLRERAYIRNIELTLSVDEVLSIYE